MKFSAVVFVLCLSLFFLFSSCKKSSDTGSQPKPADMSGSLLDSKIDTTWKAPDGSVINIKIVTSYGPKSTFNNDLRNAYHALIYSTVKSGTIKNINVHLTYRHFPQNYSELDKGTGYSYAVDETAFSNSSYDPTVFPVLEVYYFIPDPGPIDKVVISM